MDNGRMEEGREKRLHTAEFSSLPSSARELRIETPGELSKPLVASVTKAYEGYQLATRDEGRLLLQHYQLHTR